MATIIQLPLLGWIAGCPASPAPDTDDIPASLRVPATEVLKLQIHGVGVQIYQCQAAKDDAVRFEWQLKEPQAELFDAGGKRIGKHYVGPVWEASDGSKVTGDLVARAANVLRTMLSRHPDDTIVLVGHDSVNRALLMQLLEQPLSAYWRIAQSPCCLNEIDVAAGKIYVQRVNETAHLEA